MKDAILHISDLHLSEHSNVHKPPKKSSFLLKLEQLKSDYNFTDLLVTGDISDSGLKQEYVVAKKYFEDIIDVLQIEKDRVILIPGNHDIHRASLQYYCQEHGIVDAYKQNKVKQNHFINFYNEFFSGTIVPEFDENKIIFRNGVLFGKIYYICVNSNYGLGFENGGIDYDIEQLKSELASLNIENPTVILTHNVLTNVRNKDYSECNYDDIVYVFNSFNISASLGGHVHEYSLQDRKSRVDYRFLSANKMGISKHEPADIGHCGFQLIQLVANSAKIGFASKLFVFDKGGIDASYWVVHDELKELIVSNGTKKTAVELLDADNPMSDDYCPKNVINTSTQSGKSCLMQSPHLSDSILSYIKDNHILTSGHFHLGDKKRVHSIINTEKLIADRYAVRLVQDAFISMIDESDASTDSCVLLGYGMVSNSIGSRLMMTDKFRDSFYTYYPDRSTTHGKHESSISSVQTKCIIVITDIVLTGGSIMDLVRMNLSLFSGKSIYIFSIIHSGQSLPSCDFFAEIHSLLNCESVEYRAAVHLPCHPCQYTDEEQCPIYRYGLDNVYKLY